MKINRLLKAPVLRTLIKAKELICDTFQSGDPASISLSIKEAPVSNPGDNRLFYVVKVRTGSTTTEYLGVYAPEELAKAINEGLEAIAPEAWKTFLERGFSIRVK